MPARYIMNNQLGESGHDLTSLSNKFKMLDVLEEENDGEDVQGEIGKESRELQRNPSATRDVFRSKADAANITGSIFGVSLD